MKEQYVHVQSLFLVVVLQIDQVILCLSSSVNQQGLVWNLYYVATIVVRKQINFRRAFTRSERSSCDVYSQKAVQQNVNVLKIL